ncbi:MAG: hypothetical protein PHW13_03255 [Methylococcales bacterium]|nr:hypothetical protein [Methylococcales bacterium]
MDKYSAIWHMSYVLKMGFVFLNRIYPMFYFINKLRSRFNKIVFNNSCNKIRLTRPIKYQYRDDIRILSLLHHDAVDMYLLAIKSFLYNFTVGSVYVLNDGSLTESDIELLEHHIPKITIQHIKNIDTTGFPVGNVWERLLYYIDLSKDAYVIQLDSDTLSMKPMLDLHQAIKDERGFVIGNGPAWETAIDVSYMANLIDNWMEEWQVLHVQVAAERVFHLLPFFENSRGYLRGCAGFTGLPKGQVNREMLMDFSQQVSARIGAEKWNEWGSEQVACTVMISKTKDAMILPWLSYQNYGFPSLYKESLVTASLAHFIGTNRFADLTYRNLCLSFIKDYDGK